MILVCSSCAARYLAPDAAFAEGGRRVRCARCRREWWVEPLPIERDASDPEASSPAIEEETKASESGDSVEAGVTASMPPQLPALVKEISVWQKKVLYLLLLLALGVGSLLWPILDREPIVKTFPQLRGFYEMLHLHVKHSGGGLVFDQVKSELRSDGGAMWLYVDGVIHNTTDEMQLIPDIKARALGPDRHILQSWWVEAPASAIPPGGETPFHTRVIPSLQRTVESVYLEFYARNERGDVVR